MKNYIGKKIRGFRFGYGIDGVIWEQGMEAYIGKKGLIINEFNDYATIEFNDDETWNYPISLIKQHLVDVDTLAEIPQLGQGVLMEVSDDCENWFCYNIIAKLANGKFIDDDAVIWKHARPIQPPKYTHAELVEKLGEDFIYEK